jgi:hypothetical protein
MPGKEPTAMFQRPRSHPILAALLLACSSSSGKGPATAGDAAADAPPPVDLAAPADTTAPDAAADLAPGPTAGALDALVADVSPDRAPDVPPIPPDAAVTPDLVAAETGTGPVGAPCTACLPVVNAIDLDVLDMVFDSTHRRLYATIKGADAPGAEGLAFIDPVMRRVTGTMAVGPGARALAISADNSTLWISVEREFAIRRLDLTTTPPTLGPLVPLPPDGTLSMYKTVAGSMLVLPGTSRSVLVSMIFPELSYSFADVLVMDDGVARPMRPSASGDPIQLTGGPPGYAFGYNTHSTGFELCALTISATGLSQTCHYDLIGSKFGDDVTYADGRIYGHGGSVVDVTTPNMPKRAGTFAFHGAVIPQPGRRILMLSGGFDLDGGYTPQLRVLEADNFTQVTSADLPSLGSGEFHDGMQIADDEVAAIGRGSSASRIIFVKSPLVRPGG